VQQNYKGHRPKPANIPTCTLCYIQYKIQAVTQCHKPRMGTKQAKLLNMKEGDIFKWTVKRVFMASENNCGHTNMI